MRRSLMNNLVEIYCDVDDFFKKYERTWTINMLGNGSVKRLRHSALSPGEIMTIVVLFHMSGYRTFKDFYLKYVYPHLKAAFPKLVSYSQMVRLKQSVLMPLCAYLTHKKGSATGISYVDSTPIRVCHNKRINRHKTFAGLAQRGKCSMGWFYGFKLHLVVNEQGELVSFCVTPGNTDDRKPVPKMAKSLWGKLFGDRGYISSKLTKQLREQKVQLITSIRGNMKNKLLPLMDKILLRKRFLIETINDQLKNISQIEHSRHRSVINFMVNIVAGLIAYTLQPKKPSLNIRKNQLALMS